MRGADLVARRGDRVGIDVAADLAGDVGLARQLQHLRAEGRLEVVVLGDIGERVDQLRVDVDRLAASRPPPSPAISVRMASVCAACQRLNGSASVRSRKRRSAGGRSIDRRTGAEKPRRSDGTGRRRDAVEDDGLARLGQVDDVAFDAAAGRRCR